MCLLNAEMELQKNPLRDKHLVIIVYLVVHLFCTCVLNVYLRSYRTYTVEYLFKSDRCEKITLSVTTVAV